MFITNLGKQTANYNKSFSMKHSVFILLTYILLLSSCQNETIIVDETSILEGRGELLSYEFINTILAQDIHGLYPEGAEYEGDVSNLPNYDIDLYRIVYQSIQNNELVQLSGLIVVPIRDEALSHMQYHHGTMYPYPFPFGEGNLDAPSLYDGKPTTKYDRHAEVRIFGNYLGSYGYLVSIPDYAGYAVSENLEHPYSVNTLLAEQSVDMILATRAFCEKENIGLDGSLFFSGWSEGGAACVAAQRLIEEKYQDQIEITGNAPLAGFFNIAYYANLMLSFIPLLDQNWGESLDVLIWTFYAMNKFGPDPIPNERLFKHSVTSQLDILINRPSSKPSQVMKLLDVSDKAKLLNSFRVNGLAHGWAPKAPIFVHQGVDDDIVFYDQNTEVMVNNLNRLGGDVTLYAYEGHNHYTLVMLYLLKMIEDFDNLR